MPAAVITKDTWKRLGEGGFVIAGQEKAQDNMLVKRAILVHEGVFASMDGEVHVDSGRCQRVAANMNALYAKMGHEYKGKVPIGAFIPVLDQHADDSNKRVNGRVTGNFKAEIMDIPMVGKGLWCVTSDLTFSGKDAIEMVEDGRIYHLSVCLGETSETISEVSSVIEPAAPGAMLLSKAKKNASPPLVPASSLTKNKTTGDSRMPKALLQKRLAAKKERIVALKVLTAGSEEGVRLAKEKKENGVRLAAEAKVTARLSGLMKSGRMTPAEFKKQDMKRLAAMKPDDFEATAKMWDSREPVILPGQRGSTAAPAASDLRAQAGSDNFKRLKKEAQDDVYKRLGRKAPKSKESAAAELARSVDAEVEFRLGAPKRLADEEAAEDDKKKMSAEGTKHLSEMEKCMEAGDMEGSKKHMAEFKKLGLGGSYAGGDLVAEGLEKVLSEQQMAIDQLHVQLAKLNDALKLMLAAEEAEEQEMAGEAGAAGEEGSELEEGAEDPAKKELGAEGGEAPPPAKKEGEGEAPPPKKEGKDAPPPKKEGEEK